MKALVLTEYRQMEVQEMPVPEVGPRDVLIRVRACGICGSDIHGYDGSSGRRIPPLVMGHELAGEVAAVGADVRAFRPGDRVTCDSTVYCGECHFCRRGEINLCEDRRVLGVSTGEYRQHGGFAEYLAVPEYIVYILPDEVDYHSAAMVEPLAVAFHAVDITPLHVSDSVVVVGAGMIGLLVIQALRAAGAGKIFAVDLDDERLQLACRLGADYGLRADDQGLLARIQAETGGRGADRAFEVVGISPTFKTALAAVRKGGSLTLVGNLSPTVEFGLQAAVTREITLYGACASRGEYPLVLEMLRRGKVNVRPLISAAAPLEDGPAWFARLYAREAGLMKVILEP